jgi:broad specificity phosphatase PhoE
MKLFFVRHGEIPANRDKIYAGSSSERLTLVGRKQADEIGRILAQHNIEAVFHSPLMRTKETAEIICQYMACEPRADESFDELKMGPWEGLTEHEIASRYPDQWRLWNSQPANVLIAGRETLSQLQRRVLTGVRAILSKAPSLQTVLIVTHVAIIRVIILSVENGNLNHYRQIPVPNCSVFSYNSIDFKDLL